jgi:1-phosphofructokinase family hexose kinase
VITVAGLTPSLDLTYTVASLKLGQIHRVPEVIRCAGGKALNMARAASTVGADVTVVALLGGTTGTALMEMLRIEGLNVIVVDSPEETRTCVSIAAADSAQLTEIYQEAAPIPEAVWRSFESTIESALKGDPGWLSISGRAPVGSAQVIGDLVRMGRCHGMRVAVDSHSEALPEAVAAGPALIKVNRYEAAELLELAPDSSLLSMATAIHDHSGAIVALTDGTAGSIVTDGRMAVHAQAPAVEGRYSVGSGDSYLGGLVASLDGGHTLSEAVRLATACGVANALVPGQGHFSQDSVARIADQVQLLPAG